MSIHDFLKIFLFFILNLFLLPLSAPAQYYPDSNWQTKKSGDAKMKAQMLDSAVRFAMRNETKTDYDLRLAVLKAYANEPDYKILGPTRHRGKPAGIILRNGYIVAQWGDVDRVDMTFSVTKSYLSTIAGLAIDKQLIKNIDDRVHNYVWDESLRENIIQK
jgi:hypothetical protein